MDGLTRLSFLALPLIPFYLLYRAGWWAWYAGVRWFGARPEQFPGKVISIGNVEWGGTGKTALVIEIARFLSVKGKRVCVLSRGYGRRSRGTRRVMADESNAAQSYGDEPVQIAREVREASVWVGRDRREAARAAVAGGGVDVFVLDDGLQVMNVHKDLEVVMMDPQVTARRPMWLRSIFFRAPLSLARHADAVVWIGASDAPSPPPSEKPRRSEFHASYRVTSFRNVETREDIQIGSLRDPVAAFCGLACPDRFFGTLRLAGMNLAVTLSFRDHHPFSADDIARIQEKARRAGAAALVTSSKDAVRLKDFHAGDPDLPLFEAMAALELREGWAAMEALLRSKGVL